MAKAIYDVLFFYLTCHFCQNMSLTAHLKDPETALQRDKYHIITSHKFCGWILSGGPASRMYKVFDYLFYKVFYLLTLCSLDTLHLILAKRSWEHTHLLADQNNVMLCHDSCV